MPLPSRRELLDRLVRVDTALPTPGLPKDFIAHHPHPKVLAHLAVMTATRASGKLAKNGWVHRLLEPAAVQLNEQLGGVEDGLHVTTPSRSVRFSSVRSGQSRPT